MATQWLRGGGWVVVVQEAGITDVYQGFLDDGYAHPHHLVMNLIKYAFHICGVYYVPIISQ